MGRRKRILLGLLAIVVGAPLLLLLVATGWLRSVDRTNGTMSSSGMERDYLLHVPPSYDPSQRAPVVVSMHGAGLWPASQMTMSRWNELADEHGFIVAYPAGWRIAPVPILPRLQVWRVESESGLAEDVQFIADLLDHLERSYSVDPTRVYVNGFSNGGGMAFAVSCTMAERIAAVGIVAGAQALPWSWCRDARPIPLIAFHGTADRLAPYEGGQRSSQALPFPSIPTWTALWAERNGCEPKPTTAPFAPGIDRAEYTGCSDEASVVLYTIEGGGHSWPGGKPLPQWLVGPTTSAVDATAEMWTFFREHPLPTR